MRRLLAIAAGVTGLLVLPAAPASAAFSRAVWTAPAGVTPPSAGSDDWTATVDQRSRPQQVTLGGVFEHPDGVQSVSLVLEQSEHPEGEPPCSPAGFGQTAPGSPDGATAFSFDVLLPCNGAYVVRANATSRGGIGRPQETRAIRLSLTVAVPPMPVEGLQAEITGDDPVEVMLTWEPVGEADRDPDFAGYDVERAADDGGFETIASLPDADASSYVDTRPDPDAETHTYRVVSLRRAGARSGTIGARSSPQVQVDLPRQEEPGTTETTVDAGAGTGTGSGSSGAGTTVRRNTGGSQRRASRTATTVDTGFAETLPFEGAPGDEQALPAGDPAVVARVDDDGEGVQKQTLALVAGGSAMAVGALALRRVLRQAASPYEILQ